MRQVRFILAVLAVSVATLGAASFYRARAVADAAAGGGAVRGRAHLWHLERAGWPGPRWVWTFDYAPADPDKFAQAQVYVSPAGRLVDSYNVACLRSCGR